MPAFEKVDIIVVGATGYTGRITCKYMHSLQKAAGTWGIAGRNAAKLADLKRELGIPNLPVYEVDITKPELLDAMCKGTSCVISCAGPFNAVGMPIVEACVRNGVHYIDSTGEFNFVRAVADRFHTEAAEKHVTLVSCCGWDCVPSDLGNYLVHRAAKDEKVREVKAYFELISAGISSGTAHSIVGIADHMTKDDYSACSLVPKGAAQPISAPTRLGLWFDLWERRWTGPYIMAAANERIVRRSNALQGSTASYVEAVEGGLFRVLAATTAFYVMGLALVCGPVSRYLVNRLFPADVAYGPSQDDKKVGRFSARFVGRCVSGKRIEVSMTGNMDMYDVTGLFLAECALSAVTLSKKNSLKGGVLTPAAAFGDELVSRCTKAGVNFAATIDGTKQKGE